MAANYIRQWECYSCGCYHEEHDAALHCCRPEPLETFECEVCGEMHPEAELAEGCCRGSPEEQQELERRRLAGLEGVQQALPINEEHSSEDPRI